jgi:hypothetical protein
MAQELLVGEQLTPDMIQSGKALVAALDKIELKVKGAFWLLLSEQHIWRLIIASPEVGVLGPKAVYRKIDSILVKLPDEDVLIGIKDISVVEEKYPIYLGIRSAISTGPGISGIRFSRNIVNGQLIDDAYIYRAT